MPTYFLHLNHEEEFEDIKGVIVIRKSKKNRQHNGQKKKYKRTNNDLQNIHIKLKIVTSLKTVGELRCSEIHIWFLTWLFIPGFKTEEELLKYHNLHSDTIWAAVAFDPSQSYVNSLPDDVLYDLRVARLYPEARWNTDYTYDFAQTASPRILEADGDPPGKYTVM
jgi:hypothetical protein